MQSLRMGLNSMFALMSNQLIDTAQVPVIKLRVDLIKICE